MKGGKRLSEEERDDMVEDMEDVAHFIETIGMTGSAAQLRKHIAILKRDDEPEYCTCGHKHGMRNADIWACDDCGKPVKGE